MSLFHTSPVLAEHHQIVSRLEGREGHLPWRAPLIHRSHLQIVGETEPLVLNPAAEEVVDDFAGEGGGQGGFSLEGGVEGVPHHHQGTEVLQETVREEVSVPELVRAGTNRGQLLVGVDSSTPQPRKVLAASEHALFRLGCQERAAEEGDVIRVGAVRPVSDPVGRGSRREIQDRGEIEIESQGFQPLAGAARMFADEVHRRGAVAQSEVRGQGGEDSFQAVDPASFLVDGQKWRDRNGPGEIPAERRDLRRIHEIPGEQDDRPGGHSGKTPPEIVRQASSLDPDREKLTRRLGV